jgi:Ca-activated chloride channel family protein
MVVGQYTDVFAAGPAATKYYAVSAQRGQTLYLGATVIPASLRGGGVATDRLTVVARLEDGAGHPCLATARESDPLAGGQVEPTTAVVSGVVGGTKWSERCADPSRLVLAVSRAVPATAPTRVELVVRAEDPVDPTAPTAPTAPAALPAPPAAPLPHAPVRPTVGGTSYNDGPALASGTYRDTVATGETRYYRVRLGWGQRLAYSIDVTAVSGAGHGDGFIRSAVASPMRASVALAATSNAERDFGGPTAVRLTGFTLTPTAYGNRAATRSDLRGYALSGDYYLSVALSYPASATPYRTGLILTVAVLGAAVSGPRFLPLPPSASGASAATSTAVSSGAAAPVSPPAPRAAAPADGLPAIAVWAAAAGASALVVVGMLIAVARRRRRA